MSDISPRLQAAIDEASRLADIGSARDQVSALTEGRRIALEEDCGPVALYFAARLAAALAAFGDVRAGIHEYENLLADPFCPGIVVLGYVKLLLATNSFANQLTRAFLRDRADRVATSPAFAELASSERLAFLEAEAFLIMKTDNDDPSLTAVCDAMMGLQLEFPAYIDTELIGMLRQCGHAELAERLSGFAGDLDVRYRDMVARVLSQR